MPQDINQWDLGPLQPGESGGSGMQVAAADMGQFGNGGQGIDLGMPPQREPIPQSISVQPVIDRLEQMKQEDQAGYQYDPGMMERIGLAIEGLGAGLTNTEPLFMRVRQQRQQAAQTQAKLQMEKEGQQRQQVFDVVGNKDLSYSQQITGLKEMAKRGNPIAGQWSANVNEKMLGKFHSLKQYLPQTEDQYAEGLQNGTTNWDTINADMTAAEDVQKLVAQHQTPVKSAQILEKMVKQHPNEPAYADALATLKAKQAEERSKAAVQVGTQAAQIEKPAAELKHLQGQGPTVIGNVELDNEGTLGTMQWDPASGRYKLIAKGAHRVQTQDITAGTKTKNMEILDQAENVKGVIAQYRSLLTPANVGAIGDLRGVVFGAGQQADAFSQLLKGQATSVVDQLGQTSSTLNVSNFFDPKLSKGELMGNILAYQFAFMNSPDGRVSNEDFKIAQKSLGVDKLLTGPGEINAKLDALEEVVARRSGIAQRRLKMEPSLQPKFSTIEEYKKARGIK